MSPALRLLFSITYPAFSPYMVRNLNTGPKVVVIDGRFIQRAFICVQYRWDRLTAAGDEDTAWRRILGTSETTTIDIRMKLLS